MAKAVSIKVTGAEQDVLLGTVLGTLPTEAPSYDVEVALATTAGIGDHTFTLLVNGVAVMERSAINTRDRELIKVVTTVADPAPGTYTGALTYQTTEPRGDNPVAYFNAAAGSKITLNTYGGSGKTCFVYVKATENDGPALVSPVGHQGVINNNPAGTVSRNDILLGTPIGTVPNTAQVWDVMIELANVLTGGNELEAGDIGANITLLADSDTVAENFVVPTRVNYYHPRDSADEMITAMVTGGTKLTLNYFATADQAPATAPFIYRVWAVPVA